MYKCRFLFGILLTALSFHAQALVIKTFRNNDELSIELSATNQNRLMVSHDRILKAAFPDGAVTYQYDETDGSMYVHPDILSPFTLFLTTKKGRHLSLTVNPADTLGKTIAFQSYQPVIKPKHKKITQEAPFKKEALEMVKYMEQDIKMPGVKISRIRKRFVNLKNGLNLIKKETWEGRELKGELIEIYNRSKQEIKINPAWFADKNVKAMKLSQDVLPPRQTTSLYRIEEMAHG